MKNILLVIGIILLSASCRKNDFEIKNLNGDKISAFGHGGMGIGSIYPMNSRESILNCLNLGADGTEIDVQMTKDGVLVAFHDEYLDSRTNSTGKLYTKTWSEIQGTKYSSPNFAGYQVTRLDELFEHIPNRNQYTYILDIKLFNPDMDSVFNKNFNEQLLDIIDKYDLIDHTFVESKNELYIQSLRELNPNVKQFIFTDFDYALSLAKQYNLMGVTISYDELTSERVDLLHQEGLLVSTFNTHSKKRNIKAIEFNVDFIQTDRIKHLVKILK
ncbi:glycerophosphodiester phosphodiesterase [Brumimicrobium mesophilum]|uniref:glycerophosphodiester phosphodiesterase n=1 Tax=Brumimicrobium mesophilum TaxID=392717 RepID=UPI00131BDD6C|nr:glycerophosphodiester phosphodiesterase family protein [Brumimicrobium mesophilum]